MQWSIPSNNEFTYYPLVDGNRVHISSHAARRFIERVAPHMTIRSAYMRLTAEVAQAKPRCPPTEERPTRSDMQRNVRYGCTPSCVLVLDEQTNTVVTVLAFASKLDKRKPPKSRQHFGKKESRLRKQTIIRKSLSILDSLSVEE